MSQAFYVDVQPKVYLGRIHSVFPVEEAKIEFKYQP